MDFLSYNFRHCVTARNCHATGQDGFRTCNYAVDINSNADNDANSTRLLYNLIDKLQAPFHGKKCELLQKIWYASITVHTLQM